MNDGNGDGRDDTSLPGAPDPSEIRDLVAAQAGDHIAFARLYDRHAPVVLSLCRRMTGGTRVDADDALQETFIRAHRKLDKVVDGSGLRPWLYAIAHRVCSEQRRAARRRTGHEGRVEMLSPPRCEIDPASAEILQREEALDRLTDALDRLPDRERLAVHLHYLEPDPVRAAGAALGLSRSGYYKLLARARERLAVLMQEVQPS